MSPKHQGQWVDDLTYDYTGNQLTSVADATSNDLLFANGGDNNLEYVYDDNGNMTRDDNRGIDTVEYNALNLPQRVAGGGEEIQYVYDATGTKLAKTGSAGTQYYAGAMVYDETDLSYMLHDEGMVRIGHSGDARSYTYFYHLKDHLGNTRVEFQANPDNSYQVTQRQSYYPFGLRFEVAPAGENEYLYNGKEIQQDLIAGRSLGWYDYGARMYDANIARFAILDPLAEDYYFQNPYTYAANNPILYVDVNGEYPGVTLIYFEIDASAGFAYNGAYIRQSGVARDEVGKSHFIMRANMTGNPGKDGSFVLGAEASAGPEIRQSWASSTFMGLMKKDIANASAEGSAFGSISIGLDSEKGFTLGLGLGLGAKFSLSKTEVEESISLTYDEADAVNDQASGNTCWGLYDISKEENDDGLFEAYVTIDVGDDQVKTQQKVYSVDKKQWMSTNYKTEAERAERED